MMANIEPTPDPKFANVLRQQESLRLVIESISSELEFRPLLTLIVRHACELIGADNGTVGLVDKVRNVIRTEAVYHMPPAEIGAEMPPGVGLAGQIFRDQQPLRLDRYGDVEQPLPLLLADYAVIGLPIFWRGTLVGFFGIGAAPPRRFTDEDVETLAFFARHAAIAIENARSFEAEKRRTARLATINHISRLITSSVNLDQLLQTAVEAITEHLAYPNVALLLTNPQQPGVLTLRACSGIYATAQIKTYRQSIYQGIIGAAFRTEQTILVNDVAQDPRYLAIPDSRGIWAELAVPLVGHDQVLGVLNIEAEQPLTEEDKADFEIIADQLAVAISKGYLFAATQQALHETELLYQTSQRIGMALEVEEVINAYLEHIAAQDHYACSVVLYEFDAQGQRATIVVYGRWTPETGLVHVEERHAYIRDTLDPLLDRGQTVTIADVNTDPHVPPQLREIQIQSKRPALALIPLMVRGQRIGLVILSYAQVHQWSEADLGPYQVTAAQLAIAIDSRHQHQLLTERGQQLAILEERQRLARDLHDSVTQLIFSITLIAQSISPAWRRDPAEGEHRVNRLIELSQSALAEMRALLAELRPAELLQEQKTIQSPPGLSSIAQLQEHGLVTALRKYLIDIAGEKLHVNFITDTYTKQPRNYEETLYRIIQEALNNIVKHAQAQAVSVTLRCDAAAIYLTVVDDGLGLSTLSGKLEQIGSVSGLGLMTMRERAELVGGQVQFSSSPGQGTSVFVTIPRKG